MNLVFSIIYKVEFILKAEKTNIFSAFRFIIAVCQKYQTLTPYTDMFIGSLLA